MAGNAGRDKGYSKSVESQIAVWRVLMRYASRENPMSVRDICDKLAALYPEGSRPSDSTVARILPAQTEVLNLLSPTLMVRQKDLPQIGHVYVSDNKLHVVIEDPEGTVLGAGDLSVVLEARTEGNPSYGTVANLLGSRAETEKTDAVEGVPLRLKCLMRTTRNGKPEFIPYEDWQARYKLDGEPKNQPRYYYLNSALTNAEWSVLADVIKVYPYITQPQTDKFLAAINRLVPGLTLRMDRRYAFKHEDNEKIFQHIGLLDRAIREHRVVVIRYGEYGLRQTVTGLTPELRERQSRGTLRFEPYAMMWSNGYYYLVGKQKGMMNLRVDRILSLAENGETFEPDPNFNPFEYRDKSPVMYPGKPEYVHLRVSLSLIGTVLDFFGPQAKYGCLDEQAGTVEVTLNVAAAGVKLFALQYADRVEVLKPDALRQSVKETMEEALKKYK